jgi:hypothetical protein
VLCSPDPYRRVFYGRDALHLSYGHVPNAHVPYGHYPYDHDHHDVRAT